MPDQKLKVVIKVRMPLKHWQGIDHLSREPVPVFDHALGEEMLPNVQSKHPMVQLWAIPVCPIAGYQEEEISTTHSTSPFHEVIESNEILLSSSMDVCS